MHNVCACEQHNVKQKNPPVELLAVGKSLLPHRQTLWAGERHDLMSEREMSYQISYSHCILFLHGTDTQLQRAAQELSSDRVTRQLL